MVMAESLACGTPVIGSRLGAMQEIITDGRTGLAFQDGDPKTWPKKSIGPGTIRRNSAAMGREARRDYEALYTPEMNYSLLMSIYKQAIRSVRCSRSKDIHLSGLKARRQISTHVA